MIAVQLYTVRSLLQDSSRIGEVLDRLREIGYRAVEVAGVNENAVTRFGDELKRAGLVACASHVGLDRLTTDLDAVAGECREWGCEYVVVPALPERYRSREGFKRFAVEAVEIARRLSESSLRLAYHNHAYELERSGDETWLETLLNTAPEGALQAEFDTYWLQFGGAAPAEWIRRFKGRVPLTHLKDVAVDKGNPVDAEVGEGNLNWREILIACRDAGTRWLIVEQDAPRRDPLESVAISYANLTKLMDVLGWEG
jgi:sugar phosphate isomerase/epimerase